jgi:hypothetical protein
MFSGIQARNGIRVKKYLKTDLSPRSFSLLPLYSTLLCKSAKMRSFNLLALFPLAALAAINGPCTGPPDGTASGYYLTEGICLDTSDCVDTAGAAGKTINGGCPFDGNGVKCCLIGLDNSFGKQLPGLG